MAPFTPFLAEELYRKLTGGESVHLRDWPVAGHVNELILEDMAELRDGINQGLALRAKAGIKVRQPLRKAVFTLKRGFTESYAASFKEIAEEELNVKEAEFRVGKEVEALQLDTVVTPALAREGLMREVVRQVQNARKEAELNVDDRIDLSLTTENVELEAAIKEHKDTIVTETLAVHFGVVKGDVFTKEVKVETAPLTIRLQRAP